MPSMLSAAESLNRDFLEIRARILQIAAALDRLDRSEGTVADDPRVARLQQALAVLQRQEPGRAEAVQLIFSRPYEAHWRRQFGLKS